MKLKINLKRLAQFLVKAKSKTYAGEGKEILPQRPGFKELEYSEGDWNYRDSYTGYFMAPGQEVVQFKKNPVWVMAYNGGMIAKYRKDIEFARKTFMFLKKVLLSVRESKPFRGLENIKEGDWEYKNFSEGDITNFKGTEHIFFKSEEVFKQDYIGGLVIPK